MSILIDTVTFSTPTPRTKPMNKKSVIPVLPFLCIRRLLTRGGVFPYMGYIDMCGPKGYGFSAVLVINRVSILVILIINRVRFFHSSLELGMCLIEEATFSSLSIWPSTKAFHKLCLGQLCQPKRSQIRYQIFGQVISRVEKIENFGHKQATGLGLSGPHGVPPGAEGSPKYIVD